MTAEKIDRQLQLAAIKGNVVDVQELLKSGADPTANRGWALFSAIKHNRPDVVQILLKDGRINLSERFFLAYSI